MSNPLFIVLVSQVLFSASDVMGRHYMKNLGFHLASFLSWWFLVYFFLRTLATFGQLYALANLEIGRSQTLFGVAGLVFANIVGLLLFKEVLSTWAYIGVILAIVAFLLVGFSKG